MRARIAVLASGRGSNLRAILDYLDKSSGRAAYEVALVISNKSDSPALELARRRGIPAEFVEADDAGAALDASLRGHRIDIVALAGYLRKVPASVVEEFSGRIVNVHPALLPFHGGAGMYGSRVHKAVLASGDRETGVTIHLVDPEYDRGSIVAQWRIPIFPADDATSLAARVLAVEHELYPRVLDLIAVLHELNAKK